MRRKNLGNRIVKKAITWAMIVMMSFSGAMSGFASMTVYAEGVEAQVDVDENDGDLQQSYGTSAVTFDNKENTESQVSDEKPAEITEVPDLLPEGVAKNVQSAEEASKAAQNAANAAAQAVKDLSGSDTTITNVNNDVTQAQNDVKAAQDAVAQESTDATTAVESAEKIASAEKDEESAGAAYKLTEAEKIVEDSKTAIKTEEKNVETAAEAVLGATEQANAEAQQKLKEQKEIAIEATKNAKVALEEALQADNKENAQSAVAKANVAADEANEAVKKAEAIVGEVQDAYNAAKAEYDIAVKNAQNEEKRYADELAAKQKEIEDLKAKLENAQKAYGTAVENAEAAAKLATLAEGAANSANTTISAEKDRVNEIASSANNAATVAAEANGNAQTAAKAVADMFVTPADEAAKATGEALKVANKNYEHAKEDEKVAKSIADSDYVTAEQTAKNTLNNTINDIEDENSEYSKAIVNAQREYDNCPDLKFLTKADLKIKLYEAKKAQQDAIDAAKDTYDNAVKKAQNEKQQAYTEAENKTNAALNERTAAEIADADAQSLLEAEKVARDAITDKMTDNVEENQKLIDDVSKQLEGKGAQYLEYMNDLNAYLWATDARNSAIKNFQWGGKTWEPEKLKVAIEKKYGHNFFEDIWNVISIDKVKNELTDSEKEAEELVRDLQQSEATLKAKQSALKAAKATSNAAEDAQKVADQLTKVTTAATEVQTAQEAVQAAKGNVDTKKEEIEKLKTRLEVARGNYEATLEAAKKLETAKLDLKVAEKTLEDAQKELEKANINLKNVQDEADKAQRFANWANELIADHYTGVFAQNFEDENGQKVPSYNNLKEYDLTNEGMQSRPTSDFITLAQKKSMKVPYAIYRDYVEAMYDKYDSKNVNAGKGTSTGSNLDVIYWKIEDGKLTGKYYTSLDDLLSGTYFVGYAFKQEKDGYHLDGLMFEYEKPEDSIEPTPGPSEAPSPSENPSPAPTTTPGGGTTPDATPDDGGDTTVIIPDAPVALAAAPVAADNGAAVLGARRTDGDAAEAAVLGARRGTEQAVLGKRRKPQTGDSAALNAWMAAMTMATGAAGISGTKLAKGKKKEEKED